MLDENLNEQYHWKRKLEDLDCLQGEVFTNKAEVWEGLHERLRKKGSTPKLLWYWAAAACFTLTILIPAYRAGNESGLKTVSFTKSQTRVQVLPNSPAFLNKGGIDISIVPVKLKANRYSTAKGRIANNQYVDIAAQSINSVSIPVSQAAPQTELLAGSVPSADIPLNNRAPLIIKNKLRVVHINELSMPVDEDAAKEKYAERPAFYKGITSQDVFTNNAISMHNIRNNILTIKISPQN